jgi:hypothetical protein
MLVYFIEVIRDGRNVFNRIADCGTILQIIIRATVRSSQEFTSTKNRIGESSWKTGVLSLSEARVNPAAHVARQLQIRKRRRSPGRSYSILIVCYLERTALQWMLILICALIGRISANALDLHSLRKGKGQSRSREDTGGVTVISGNTCCGA